MTTREDFEWRLPYWIRTDPRLQDLWEEGVAEYGYEMAEDYVRSTDYYANKFEGIRRDDGSYRMEENEYLANMDSYRESIAAVGVNPDLFRDQFVRLIEGDVSGDEFWQERVSPVYDRVIERGDEMIQRYAQDWNIEMTREAIIASLLDPEMVGDKILNRQLGISEIRYEIDIGFDPAETMKYLDMTEEWFERGITQPQTRALVSQARTALPVLSTLAARHADPDDDFDLEEFANAELWNDPEQARRMRRLIRQERSLFADAGALEIARDRAQGVTGLRAS